MQKTVDPVDDETDEDEYNNNESSKGPSNADAFYTLTTAMECIEQPKLTSFIRRMVLSTIARIFVLGPIMTRAKIVVAGIGMNFLLKKKGSSVDLSLLTGVLWFTERRALNCMHLA
ncbi:hypothetical protein TNCV_821011 [Trichonephila clavipes]|nr:hypothetical protein TNCV_821011 [Trichonephila clavipes]